MSELVEQVARAIAPVALPYIEGYEEVPQEHIWTRPRYQWLGFAMTKIANAALSVLETRIEQLERELAEARDYARKVSIAFTDVTGGGSEMFTRIGNEFYADPEACRVRVREKYESARKFGAMQETAIRSGDAG